MHLPNVWGPQTIFTSSGIDGATDWRHPLIGAPLDGWIGLELRTAHRAVLRIESAAEPLSAGLIGTESVCANDLLDLRLPTGRVVIVARDAATFVGWIEGEKTAPVLRDRLGQIRDLIGEEAGWLALAVRQRDGAVDFVVAYHPTSEAGARARAAGALGDDLPGLAARRRDWLAGLPLPAGLDQATERCYRKAAAILKVNVESAQGAIATRWTTPDRWPHRNMWLWDSAFHAVGWARLDPGLAQEAVLAPLGMVDPGGYLAHMTSPDPAQRSVDTTQPPILAWAASRVEAVRPNLPFLAAVYEPLAAYVSWIETHRSHPAGLPLAGWRVNDGDPVRSARGGESGWDNSPRFDQVTAMGAVDLCCQLKREHDALAAIAERLGRTDNAERHRQSAEQWRQVINAHLWDDVAGCYFDCDQAGRLVAVKAGSSFLSLWAGVAEAAQAARLVERLTDPSQFWRPLPVPSVAADEPSYSDDMWRGPTWLNINLLLVEGLDAYGYSELADQVAERVIAEVTRWYGCDGTLWEYYDQEAERSPSQLHRKGGVGRAGGTGFGVIRDYDWSAAVLVELCWRRAERLTSR